MHVVLIEEFLRILVTHKVTTIGRFLKPGGTMSLPVFASTGNWIERGFGLHPFRVHRRSKDWSIGGGIPFRMYISLRLNIVPSIKNLERIGGSERSS